MMRRSYPSKITPPFPRATYSHNRQPMSEGAKPFIKWAGGKRWLAPVVRDIAPKYFNKYIEPFVGGAAIFFALAPKYSVLGDLNGDLINVYKVVRDSPEELSYLLKLHHSNHCRDHYYSVRAIRHTCDIHRAADFLYLNRTCWNGLYRVNLRGEFNVPIGTKTKVYDASEDLVNISSYLKNTDFIHGDFETTLSFASDGDFVFVDPPYTVKHNFNGFLKYNEKLFSWSDQIRLRDCCLAAKSRGASIVISNADHESVRELYTGYGEIDTFARASVIAGSNSARQEITELLVRMA